MTASTLREKNRPARILHIEDNLGDAKLLKLAFTQSAMHCDITNAKSAEWALRILKDETLELPDLILLDLNLQSMNGTELLEIIKQDPLFKHIPVIILSSSVADSDVRECYAQHANGYIAKPRSIEGLNIMAKRLEAFWFSLAIIPNLTRESEE